MPNITARENVDVSYSINVGITFVCVIIRTVFAIMALLKTVSMFTASDYVREFRRVNTNGDNFVEFMVRITLKKQLLLYFIIVFVTSWMLAAYVLIAIENAAPAKLMTE